MDGDAQGISLMKRETRKICLFAGTTEGRLLAERLAALRANADVFAATDYGKEELPESETVRAHAGRLDGGAIRRLLVEGDYGLVIDATHPYAREVTENIRTAAEAAGLPLWRILRASCDCTENGDGKSTFCPDRAIFSDGGENASARILRVRNAAEAAAYLCGTEGNILVTTGSRELSAFCVIPDWEERVYARVLSVPEAVADCAALGFRGKHLIAMQGPFSRELNAAMLRSIGAKWLVTKESGKPGGYEEKLLAAADTGACVIVIGRPAESGISLDTALMRLEKEFGGEASEGEKEPVSITLIGTGPGNPRLLTGEAREAMEGCDLIAGAASVTNRFSEFGKPVLTEYRAGAVLNYLSAHPEYRKVAVLFSGDTGFFSGAGRFLREWEEETGGERAHAGDSAGFAHTGDPAGFGSPRLIPGISLAAYFFSRTGDPWENTRFLSLHGRDADLVRAVRENCSVFLLAGSEDTLDQVCKRLLEAGLGDAKITVGENLSLTDERIEQGTAETFLRKKTGKLAVFLVENRAAGHAVPLTHGLSDEAFVRGATPMTKMEVRAVSIAKLGLCRDSVLYDVGAGTGSVAVECARLSPGIRVFAIERDEEALSLLSENRARFGLSNMEIVAGSAPEAFLGLPAPTHVFIGGSGGKLKEIAEAALKKNPGARFVANFIMPESVAEAAGLLESGRIADGEIVQLTVARSRKTGAGHLMIGHNPIWIVSFTGNGGGIQ